MSFTRNKEEKLETKVARAKDIVRNLNATQVNSSNRYHLGVSYVKANQIPTEAARDNFIRTDVSKK